MKFLNDLALLVKDSLIVADLHIGIEYEFFKSGIVIPSQVERLKERIERLIEKTRAKRLIILGDVKHKVPGITWQEYKDVPRFFEHFSKIEVICIKGNHDGFLERLAPKFVKIYGPKGYSLGNVALVHGHAWPSKKLLDCKYLVMAHVHPAIEFWSESFRSVESCWLRCEINKEKLEKKYKRKSNLKYGVIMPAFNHLIGGIPFNSQDFEPLGPLLKNRILEWENSEVYLTDGIFLGNLADLRSEK
jgi:hypothetical protein